MYYAINVSLNGKHFFATAKRSLTDLQQAEVLYAILCSKFPPEAGYRLTLARWETKGHIIDSTLKNAQGGPEW